MDITRRVFVSGAMALPFLGKVGTAEAESGSAAAVPTLTVLDGLTELRMTETAIGRLRDVGVELFAVAPAQQLTAGDGSVVGVALQPEFGRLSIGPTGLLTSGAGRALGGVGLRGTGGLPGAMEIVGLRGDASDGLVFAFLKIGDQWQGELPLYRVDVDEVRLVTEVTSPTEPTRVTGSRIPLRPTQEGIDAFATAFGPAVFNLDDVVAICRGEGRCWPLPQV